MSTKRHPGRFDCYANADDDEPMFILLARDRHAPQLVAYWAHLRQLEGTTDRAKIAEALDCSEDMRTWREKYERTLEWRAQLAERTQSAGSRSSFWFRLLFGAR